MSGVHRAVKRAEREGLLTWTQGTADQRDGVTAVDTQPVDAPVERTSPTTSVPVETYSRASEGQLSPLLVAATQPDSFAADQYRVLRARLERQDNNKRIQLLLITSPRSGDGKTTTSANLALTMSREIQQKVVLVEVDIRRPTLARLFGVPGSPGLVDALMGKATLEETLIRVPGHQLYLLPAGLPTMPSTELFASSMMHRAVSFLRGRFGRIVFDTPPASAADTQTLARLADAVLVVVRAGVTPQPPLARTLANIDRQKLTGIVLNEVDTTPEEYGYQRVPPRESGT